MKEVKPWAIGSGLTIWDDRGVVAQVVSGGDPAEDLANARLIAGAPAMLAALKKHVSADVLADIESEILDLPSTKYETAPKSPYNDALYAEVNSANKALSNAKSVGVKI